MARAMFGAGCFWGVEAAFRRVVGVLDTRVGFSGGHVPDPSYEEVARGTTGHAQVVLIEYDPDRVTYAELVERFWRLHDPTQRNRQGRDVGPQYRSVIFCFDDEQRRIADGSRRALERSGSYPRPIVTEIVAAGPFYAAEEEHQRYYEKRGLMAASLFGRSCSEA